MVASGSSMRILLVDDVQLDRMQLAIRLKQLGHNVEAVSSGREALLLYPQFDPELVLLDISMPDMDGFQLSQAIRSSYPNDWIPIIFLSGHDEPTIIAQAIEAGGDDYLTKPVDKLVLNSKLLAMQRIANMRRELKRTSAKLEELNRVLQHQANEDGLTQVFNRRFMDEKLKEMISWHGRHGGAFTVILFDVDQFKPYNDNYGHIEGDRCLYTIAQVANKLFCRSGEYVGRYGGEEFVVMLSHNEECETAAERIQMAIHELCYPHAFSTISNFVTVSQGVASVTPTGRETLSNIYEVVDKALYQAKIQGRDRYVIKQIDYN
ncbi:diguanylate cyclase [Vibrio diazotrophicus]|uniref:GGDEF domain-containing response regulator n=1 Tax=Vibrio diazotrophicus TaxID=685 RepID=UPI0022AFB618|nr:diguanylate cyclase [Vibrio diazotrophicus]MCZ4370324.1 diguanylate cyclase [Vibrio diazotrophicus]